MGDFFKDLWTNNKRTIIEVLGMIILFVWALLSMQRCSTMKLEYNTAQNNIVALTDSIEYYESKTGELIAQKTMLTGEIKDLKESHSKELNDLYNDLNSMKRKNAQLAAQIDVLVENPARDTIWKYDSILVVQSLVQPFQFNDKWRNLSGNITLENNTMGLNIKEDQVFFNYTIAVEDGLVYLMSDNPYVKYNRITAIQETQKKPKRWNIGFQLGLGFQYGLFHEKVDIGPYLGLGVSYGFGF
jgi:cell division protein FtsB